MGPEDGSRSGKRKVRELCGPDGARRSTVVSSEYGETQVSARRTGLTSLNINERARSWGTGPAEQVEHSSLVPMRVLKLVLLILRPSAPHRRDRCARVAPNKRAEVTTSSIIVRM